VWPSTAGLGMPTTPAKPCVNSRHSVKRPAHDLGEAERDQGEVPGREPEGRQRHDRADRGGRHHGQQRRRPERPLMIDHRQRHGIRADRHQRAVAQRDLTAIAVQQVEPDRHQHIGRHLRGDEQPVFGADREGREIECERQSEQQGRPGARRADQRAAPYRPWCQTARASARPNRPCGRISRIASMTAKAAAS